MQKKVLISIKGVQAGQEDEAIEVITTGSLYDKNDKLYVHYIDTQLDDTIETKTSIKIEPDKVTVDRFGAVSSRLIYEKDVKHTTYYETPMGILEMTVLTSAITFSKAENGFELVITYELLMEHQNIGPSSFFIKVKEID